MKKSIRITSLVTALALVLTVGVAASIYFPRLAGMRTFSGRIENYTASNNEPQLVLSVGDHLRGYYVGEEGDISSDGTTFPVLVDAYSDPDSTNWYDSNGKEAISAPTFILSTTGGKVEGASFRIELGGDTSAAKAMRFGVTTKQYGDDGALYRTDTNIVELNVNTATSDPVIIGDIAGGEMVEVYVSAWVMADEFANVDYEGGDMTVDVVFSSLYAN